MKKLPINEAAEFLGISKEAVYNRVRRGTLKTTQEDGLKFVILDNDSKVQKKAETKTPKKQSEGSFVSFLLSELEELKDQNKNLQLDKERLFKEKEQMLIDSKSEIIAIYKDRDEKLMRFLNAMQKPYLEHKNLENDSVIEAEIDENHQKKFINLSEFLKNLHLDTKSLKKIQKKIIKRVNKSKFIKFKEGVIFVRKNKDLQQILGES